MELKKTLIMNKGTFEMRGNLPLKEPNYVKKFEEMKLYERLLKEHEGQEEFYLHDGPPYANGDMHAGHALNKILKDIINRYKNLKGYYVRYIPGWDTHGLPIENAVTKSGVDRKQIPTSEFRKACMKYAYKQVERQKKQILRLGILGDFDHPYLTLDKEYEAKQIEVFADMALKGYIYKGLKPVNWSPSSESALAEAEIEYQDVEAKTIFVRFKVTDGRGLIEEDDSYFVIWTTTPWTLPANLAICLNPEFEYGLFKTDKGNLVFLKKFEEELSKTLGLKECTLIKSFKGKDAEYIKVQHPFMDHESLVILGDYVSDDAGTGCVHIAPGHGLDDYKVCLKYNIPPFCPVDEHGNMTKEAGERLEGMFYEEANEEVLKMLEEKDALLHLEKIVHAYPHDWRTKKPLIFRATPQWFCSISKFRDEILKEVEEVEYFPSWGKVRLRKMIEGREDWCISRQRVWGVPIPIIYCEDGTPILEKEVFDNIQELIRLNGSNIWFEKEAKDLLPLGYTNAHSPNGIFTKEKDIMDVWFDSGSSFYGVNVLRGCKFPCDIYLEGNDQYRGWYNSSLILSVATGHKSPFKKIITHGMIVDGNGEKFSKSKGNGVDPNVIAQTYGADILRLWVASIDYTAESKLSEELLKIVAENYRKIRNSLKFMLANLCDVDNQKVDLSKPYKYEPIDELVLAKLDELLAKIDKEYETFDFIGVSSLVLNFITNDLSSFYLDVSKDVLYCDGVDSLRRKGCQHVIERIVTSLAIVLSPILCFTMEEVNEHLPSKLADSIALASYPHYEIDEAKVKMYNSFMSLRDKVNKALENARNEKVIDSFTQAKVNYVTSSKEEREVIDFLASDIARLLGICSFTSLEGEDSISVIKTSGYKCERCWNYFDEVLEDDEGHKICPRCHKVISNE